MSDPTGAAKERARERQQIQAAAERLLAGEPLRSTGALTVVQLAVEAELKRWLLTHRHIDLTQKFQSAARQLSQESPLVEPWKQKVARLEKDLREAHAENAELRKTNTSYARMIHNLDSILNSRESVAPMHIRGRRN